ncbi:MAG: 2-dehydropantoate 2-reductase [Thermoplasmata archaeon]
MTVVVLGAGAVGSLFGARFRAAGHRVLLIGRPAHVTAVRTHGLRVDGAGAGTFDCEAATELPRGFAADLALLTVKTFDLAAAASELGRALSPLPTLLPQNGLGVEPTAIAALGAAGWPDPGNSIVRAVHSVPATWIGPGVIRAAGTGEVILPAPGGEPAPDGSQRFADLFRSAGFTVRTVGSIDREVWRKAIVNAAINPITAVHRVPNGRLASGPLREEALRLLTEALSVASALGLGPSQEEALSDFDRIVRATAENRSSMLQDIDRGRPTEIEAISGEILRLGETKGIPLPATRSIVVRVRADAARGARAAQPS